MGFSTGLTFGSPFANLLEQAKKISAEKAKARKPLSEEGKQRQRERSKAWRERRLAENLAQRELIISKR